jgi:MFS family permease
MSADGSPAPQGATLNPLRWRSLAAVCLLIGLGWVVCDGFVIAIPTIGRAVGGSTDAMAWAVNGFSLVAGMAAFFGRLGDLTGNRRVVVIGGAILVLGSVIGGLAETSSQLILARVLQGIGGTAIFTCALSVLTMQFPPDERPRVLSIRQSVSWGAAGLSVLILAVLVELLGWKATFWGAIPVAVLGLVLVATTTPEFHDRSANSKLDFAGALILTAAFFMVSYTLFESEEMSAPRLVLMVVIAALLFGLFVVVESRSADPLIPLSIWRHRIFTGAIVSAFVFNGVMVGLLYLLALYLQTVGGLGAVDTAKVLIGGTIAVIITNPIGALLARRGSFQPPVVAGMLLMSLGLVAILFGIKADSNAAILGGLIVLGAAVGIQTTPISILAVSSTDATKGTASGVVAITFGLSNAIGIALATAIMQNVAIGSLKGATGSNQLEGIDHQELLDILTGIRPMNSLSSAGQQVVTAAFDKGAMTTIAIFAVLVMMGAALATKTLRNVVLHDG